MTSLPEWYTVKKSHRKTIRNTEKGAFKALIVVPMFYITCSYCLGCSSICAQILLFRKKIMHCTERKLASAN